MRLDKLEKEKSLNDQRFSSIEQVIDDKGNDKTPPKLKMLIQDVSKMKKSINNDNEKRDDEDNKLRKLSYSQIITKQQDQSNIPTQLHVQENKYYDYRGKVGISPITIDDIRQFSQDKEATDEDLVSFFQFIKARLLAAQNFLSNQLMFQEGEIEIKTLKMSTNIQSKVMWIETGELNVRRIFHRMKNLRNPAIQLINYIPPELWERKKQLDIKLKAEKNVNKDFRYIVKLGKADLCLLTKTLGKTFWEEDEISRFLDEGSRTESNKKRRQSPQTKPPAKRSQHEI